MMTTNKTFPRTSAGGSILALIALLGLVGNAQATQQYMDYYGAPACTSCHSSGILNKSTGQAGLTAYLATRKVSCVAPQVLQNNVCVTPSDSDRIFNYLEAAYPGYLSPAGSASSTISGYYYRAYPTTTTNAYIATANGTVYYLGPASQNQLFALGSVSTWLATASAAGY